MASYSEGADDGQRLEKLLSLESLVSNLSAFNAAKPHDIIYAVLSLANDTVTSAKASEIIVRRVSITGPIVREPVGPQQGAQKSGVAFINAVKKPGNSQHKSTDAVKEDVVKNDNNQNILPRGKMKTKLPRINPYQIGRSLIWLEMCTMMMMPRLPQP